MRTTIVSAVVLSFLACGLSAAGEIVAQKRYLHFPVGRSGQVTTVRVSAAGELVHYFGIPLAKDKEEPLYWASIDIASYRNKLLTIAAPESPGVDLAAVVEQSDTPRRPPKLFGEKYRPQFHFTAPTGWINDPNGLVFLDGEYHLFYQHNPYGTVSANKSWGHAVSRDLVQWTDLGDVLLPDRLGAIYSGSAVVDRKNTSGLGKDGAVPMVAIYTSAGGHAPAKAPYTQSLAYSLDRGRTWMKYAGNPVLGHITGTNRDPKVFWHQASSQWIMILYLERGKFVLFGSKNLKEWSKLSDVPFPDGFECPELFELPLDGDGRITRWVLWEGGGRHMIGRFDGKEFVPERGVLPSEWGKNCYAGQTWNDAPDGRHLYICWMRARTPADQPEPAYPDMLFNQQMSFPREFQLRTTAEGIRLFAEPAREIRKLYGRAYEKVNVAIAPGGNPLSIFTGELFDIHLTLEPRSAKSITLNVRGTPITYDAPEGLLSCLGKSVRVSPGAGALDLRVLVDRTSIEIFIAGGRYVMSFCVKPDPQAAALDLTSSGGAALAKLLKVRELKPALPAVAAR